MAELEVTLEPKIKAQEPEYIHAEQESRGIGRYTDDSSWLDIATPRIEKSIGTLAENAKFREREGWSPSADERITWLVDSVRDFLKSEEGAPWKRRWDAHGVDITPPRYPSAKKAQRSRPSRKPTVRPQDGYVPRPRDIEAALRDDSRARIKRSRGQLADFQQTGRVKSKEDWLGRLGIVHNYSPEIFLSFPSGAAEIAESIKNRVLDDTDDLFKLSQYQEQDFSVISDEVVRRIASADYFIGIWHHEEVVEYRARSKAKGKKMYAVSPWLPYELGIARQCEIPSIVVYSKLLPKSLTSRVNLAIAEPSYDPSKPEIIARRVARYVREHWMTRDHAREPESGAIDSDGQPDKMTTPYIDLREIGDLSGMSVRELKEALPTCKAEDLALILEREHLTQNRTTAIAAIRSEIDGRKRSPLK